MFLISETAEKAFDNLKKKYSRKRLNYQTAMRSGAGTNDVKEAQKELLEYAFLSWLDQYIRPRKSKSNIDQASSHSSHSSQTASRNNSDDEFDEPGDNRSDVNEEQTVDDQEPLSKK